MSAEKRRLDEQSEMTAAIAAVLGGKPLPEPIGIVDIGGNSMEALVLNSDGTVLTEKHKLISGKSIGDREREGKKPGLSDKAKDVLREAFASTQNFFQQHGINTARQIYAFATGGLRNAGIDGLSMQLEAQTKGLPVRIIPPLFEGILAYLAVTFNEPDGTQQPYLVAEIGGASTELVFGSGKTTFHSDLFKLLQLGTGRLGLDNPQNAEDVRRVVTEVEGKVDKVLEEKHQEAARQSRFMMKFASEFLLLDPDSDQSVMKNGLSREQIQYYLSQEGIEKIQANIREIARQKCEQKNGESCKPGKAPKTEQQRIDDMQPKATKLISKLIVLEAVMRTLNIDHLYFGPSWGAKFGALLWKLQNPDA